MRRHSFDNECNTFEVLIQLKGGTRLDHVPLLSFSQLIYWWGPNQTTMDHQEGKTKQNWRPMEIDTCTSQKLEGSFVYSSEPNTLGTWTCAFPSTISSVQNIQLDIFVSRSWSVPTVMLVKGGTGSTDCCWLVTHSICNITQFELCTIEGCPYELSSKQRYESMVHIHSGLLENVKR